MMQCDILENKTLCIKKCLNGYETKYLNKNTNSIIGSRKKTVQMPTKEIQISSSSWSANRRNSKLENKFVKSFFFESLDKQIYRLLKRSNG